MIDYAYPMMMAEKALKDAHEAMLKKDHDMALEKVTEALVEVKMTLNSIRDMKEQADALRK
jgi:hypothetical protein